MVYLLTKINTLHFRNSIAMNKIILFKKRPEGKPGLENFQITEEKLPQPGEGEVLLKSLFISVDPYLRSRMRDEKSYIPPFKLNEPMESMIVAEVTDSKNSNFEKGDFVSGMLDWKEYQTSPGKGLTKLHKENAPLTAYLGILGLTGLTAYIALNTIGKPKRGETLVVSGAAGAVGSVAGQLGKLYGCRVVGIAGTDEKIQQLTEEFGFDAGINYKKTSNLQAELAEKCPDGIDIYFDNVGGIILDAVMTQINDFARIINCGAISVYNEEKMPTGPRVEGILIKKSALMQGFLVRNHAKEFGPAINQLSGWLSQGKLKHKETIVKGFENTPQAFLDIFEGKNKGKMIVKV